MTDSLKVKLESMYFEVTVNTVKSMGFFVCVKGHCLAYDFSGKLYRFPLKPSLSKNYLLNEQSFKLRGGA